jgi:4'-phosphopantetheinyl transferase EntD
MPNRSDITDATDEEVLLSLSCALHHDGRKRFQHADDIKARLVAEHLLNHLKRSNYVIMRGPARTGHSTPPIPK